MELRYNVLSKREREKLLTILYGERNIEKNFTLLPEELKRIESFGKPHWKLGYAIQLLFLKNRGVSIISNKELLSPKIVEYVANQIGCIPDCLQWYWNVKNIRFNHFQEICNILEFKKFEVTSKIETFIYNKVLSIGEPIEVMENLIEELRKIKVVIPALYKLEELIYKGINATDKFIFSKICEQIDSKNKLENLFLLKNGISNYSILKNIAVNNSPSGVKILLETIKTIDSYGKIIDLSFLTDSKIRYFYTEIQRSHRFRIERFSNLEKKYSYLAMFLSFKRREFVDMVIETTSNYAHTVMKRTKKKSQNYNQKNQERYKLNSGKLKDVVEYILQIKDIPTLKEYQVSLTELKK